MNIPYVPLGLATLLAVHGLRKKSLSPSGAATAFIVGTCMFAGATRVFGVTLIVFYLLGSRATKYGAQRKQKLEEGEAEGYRSGWQVLSNSASALACAIAWNYLYFGQRPVCLVDPANAWSRKLVYGALGHFACCLGDTLASELGILSTSKPRLVTTWRPVPPGTNGGMSTGGTLASIIGGLIIGATASIVAALEGCGWDVFPGMMVWGAVGGGAGSFVDSLLGATIQETKYSEERKIITQSGTTINGWNILSNNQVNVLSSILTAVWMSFV
ncbi:DUF92-domain-containing protein [Cylindrobasidium torrendii FP15055 ss-10]|uniref:DUF92-domain-containing protein n=1 Tax=Cylindrobasidium torrendii FP15055 ss-10 TaxID=1314674 RepID=A0A0D7BC97_9AGAR|nr:DUF92-domain-containing protein [Cylindrobasidium torrendii FP15055 ss-10]